MNIYVEKIKGTDDRFVILQGLNMANFTNGIEQWCSVSECLNGIIVTTGREIELNNKIIWSQYLNHWQNTDWDDMLAVLLAVKNEDPDLFEPYQDTAIAAARAALLRGHHCSRVMDSKANKRIAWRTIMTMREVHNKMNNIKVANATVPHKPRVNMEQNEEYTRITVWHNLFDPI